MVAITVFSNLKNHYEVAILTHDINVFNYTTTSIANFIKTLTGLISFLNAYLQMSVLKFDLLTSGKLVRIQRFVACSHMRKSQRHPLL
jgi:hypothetical protein